MAPPAYTVTLLADVVRVGAGALLTPPVNARWVIRDIETVGETVPVTLNFTILQRSVVLQVVLSADEVPKHDQWTGRWVVDPGQTLEVAAVEGSAWVTITGYELSV